MATRIDPNTQLKVGDILEYKMLSILNDKPNYYKIINVSSKYDSITIVSLSYSEEESTSITLSRAYVLEAFELCTNPSIYVLFS